MRGFCTLVLQRLILTGWNHSVCFLFVLIAHTPVKKLMVNMHKKEEKLYRSLYYNILI